MGSLHISAPHFYQRTSEIIGVKSGLALSKADIQRLLREDQYLARYSELVDEDVLRIRSEVYERVIEHLLYRLGRLEHSHNPFPVTNLYHKYKHDQRLLDMAMTISDEFTKFLNAQMQSQPTSKVIDPTPFLKGSFERFGLDGAQMAIALFEALHVQLLRSPWINSPEQEWEDTIELKALFESEALDALYGSFVDQRYIDYLHRNFDDIDRINWRKFEGLTAEFFDRAGLHVQLGPGRNDGGVDVRIWPSKPSESRPPAIIVQCKRQKAKISKVIVKSLYADVINERAESGLIVTTSTLSPGARTVRDARNYPIGSADRETLRKWLLELRNPGAGVGT